MTVFEVVKASLVEVVPDVDPASVTAGRTLSDLGCTSIDRAEVVTLAMERLGIVVPISEFRDVNDLDRIVELLRTHM
ncbi:phosphopantetheine-binding protein [Micromonospora aurantiaca]|jgi:polyketide biosynthesis acyl carrier protein|uniref:Phosphopantetheine-binding protein n=3 Tax=Micromonospora TaxID=1873 RepID=A0A1C6RYN1_9ACTN|nr:MULTISPECIES: phosphopantetheine-binding protein [Micromonospora]ADL47402.1 phosphopantetheine-binding [Micromonospora aurantiaca ATCC 27029]ADU10015.1 phosphopantetheine-binding protein [Micromonospora sp. L5]AXH93297.1 phosphopantetheine-binding protein [Micromonospora aurantiaca]AYF27032.1 phosphopantetheine-binding protein [Micromonospora tulbaghiae]KAB1118805.1 phosphopantetheine-binding protein [Micromonospora aurantiaca]